MKIGSLYITVGKCPVLGKADKRRRNRRLACSTLAAQNYKLFHALPSYSSILTSKISENFLIFFLFNRKPAAGINFSQFFYHRESVQESVCRCQQPKLEPDEHRRYLY